MPHVILKLLAGRSEQQKQALAAALAQAVITHANVPDSAVSVAIEDIAADRWTADVYDPDIRAHWDQVIRKPGYQPG